LDKWPLRAIFGHRAAKGKAKRLESHLPIEDLEATLRKSVRLLAEGLPPASGSQRAPCDQANLQTGAKQMMQIYFDAVARSDAIFAALTA
jgi:hypothetical protein